MNSNLFLERNNMIDEMNDMLNQEYDIDELEEEENGDFETSETSEEKSRDSEVTSDDKESNDELDEESDESVEGSEDELDEESEGLPFAKAEVVRLMKQHLDNDKMIRERVKVEMNRFLGEVLERVCAQLNEYPYTTVEYEMLKESIYPYQNISRINQEKERILMHLDAIKADCDALSMDVRSTLKLKDVNEEDEHFNRV
jgi:histone H3/H4